MLSYKKQTAPLKVHSKTLDDIVYEKLQEAELEMSLTSKRYTKEEMLESINTRMRTL